MLNEFDKAESSLKSPLAGKKRCVGSKSTLIKRVKSKNKFTSFHKSKRVATGEGHDLIQCSK